MSSPQQQETVSEPQVQADAKSQTVAPSSSPSAVPAAPVSRPVVCIVIGMAGSGKTTLMQRLNMHTSEHNIPSYIINLDPGVTKLPYTPNIDIRDTVNYKEVMKQ